MRTRDITRSAALFAIIARRRTRQRYRAFPITKESSEIHRVPSSTLFPEEGLHTSAHTAFQSHHVPPLDPRFSRSSDQARAMDSDFHATPLRQYALPDTHRWSVVSVHSAQSANSFPTYGLIKVSNSDHGSSCDSFSLVSPQGSAYWNNNEPKGSPRRRSSIGAISQSKTINPFHDDQDELKTPKTPLSAATATFAQTTLDPGVSEALSSTQRTDSRPLSFRLPFDEEAKGLKVPEKTFERVKYFLDRIIAAYHSEQGVFLTDRFFMNKQIFSQPIKGVPNGSVKIGIIQEITSLLRKFVQGDESTSLGSVEATLHYYDKLMDAFDVFASNSSLTDENDTRTTNDQQSSINSAISPLQRAQLERTNSKGDTPPPSTLLSSQDSQHSLHNPLDHTSSTSSGSLDKKKANRGSFILDKFKSAKSKRRSMLSLDQNIITQASPSQQLLNRQSKEQLQERHRSQPIGLSIAAHNSTTVTTHSRSISVSTSASSRSMRDVCQLNEYMTLLESLYYAVDEAYDVFGAASGKSTHEVLDKVISFMDTHVMVFVMKDVTSLSLKMMKESIGDYC